jgi:predicted RNA polymerase sigma factor
MPVVALNKTIAFAYGFDKGKALQQLFWIRGLETYYIYHTSIGELSYEPGQKAEAKKYFEKALVLTSSKKKLRLLQNKIQQCIQD